MSVSIVSTGGGSYQPYQCLVCQSRFTRHENLKRHAALHSRPEGQASLACELCQATFSRQDLRSRHMKRKHPEHVGRRPTRGSRSDPSTSTTEGCGARKQRRDRTSPASPSDSHQGSQQGDEGEMAMSDKLWQSPIAYDHSQFDQDNQDFLAGDMNFTTTRSASTGGSSSHGIGSLLAGQPSMSELMSIDHIVQDTNADRQSLLLSSSVESAYYPETKPRPIMQSHASSFSQSMPSLNFNTVVSDKLSPSSPPQFEDDWYPSMAQIRSGCHFFFAHVSHFVPFLHQPTFDTAITARHLLISVLSLGFQYGEDPDCGDQPGTGAILSARCFHRARALLSAEEKAEEVTAPHLTMVQSYLLLQICSMMYLCGKDSACGLRMHSKMISHARTGGLMQSLPTDTSVAGDLDSLWRDFVKVESLKRTIFAVHQIDALWYQFLSVPRQLSHLEIRHGLPCPEQHWTASSAAGWAHQQLVARQSNPMIQYPDAVRQFLSAEGEPTKLPAFDPYGAINIAQFLISSAREISGWSTMTGMLSLERFEPLRSSLVTLGPFIRQQPDVAPSKHAALCEATWETAMIELQVWSPSHVGGIVEGSIDAILNQSTYLSPHVELLCESSIAKAVQPHVDWFLRYLDSNTTPEFEAPWVTLYAYKAFLIAWQLVRGGMPGSMQIVGIHDGDVQGALAWAREVFQRRQRWQLGRLIMGCLDRMQE